MGVKRKLKLSIQKGIVYLKFTNGICKLDLKSFQKCENENKPSYCMNKQGYVTFSFYKNKKRVRTGLHRYITNCPRNLVVDHIDGNPKNNLLSNLRNCTQSINNFNVKNLHSHNTTGVKGVSFHKLRQKWRATIQINNKAIHLGLFNSFDDAVVARKIAEEVYNVL